MGRNNNNTIIIRRLCKFNKAYDKIVLQFNIQSWSCRDEEEGVLFYIIMKWYSIIFLHFESMT